MLTLLNITIGLTLGYALGSLIESMLHEYVSDAAKRHVEKWRRRPRLYRILLNTYFSHHVIHHYSTYRNNHVTQFASLAERRHLEQALLKRGRHGRIIIGGNFANRLHGEGALVFTLPPLIAALVLGLLAPFALAAAAAISLALPPLLSYAIHPYLHKSFAEGQHEAPCVIAALLRTKYFRAVYRNHFMHHRYGGTGNFNLVLGADVVRGRVRRPSAEDTATMQALGLPIS